MRQEAAATARSACKGLVKAPAVDPLYGGDSRLELANRTRFCSSFSLAPNRLLYLFFGDRQSLCDIRAVARSSCERFLVVGRQPSRRPADFLNADLNRLRRLALRRGVA